MQLRVAAVAAVAAVWFISSANAGDSRPLTLISDIDDTVKQTNVADSTAAMNHTIFGAPAFAGMPELYEDLLLSSTGVGDPGNVHLYFVTGTPKNFAKYQEKFLNEAGFPIHETRYKSLFGDSDLQTFKVARIAEIVEARPAEAFVLIGDDTQKDQAALTEVAARFPAQILARYIHRVTAASNAGGEVGFVTAADLALHEYVAGRLSEMQLQALVASLKDLDVAEELIPDFMACPPAHWLTELRRSLKLETLDPALQADLDRLELRVDVECLNRG